MPLAKIDVHSHFLPDFYRQALLDNGHERPDGMPRPPQWSEELHLEMHNKIGVKKSILSISSPGTHLVPGNDALARDLARRCNEFAADLKRRSPEQFGFFATLPLPDIQGSIEEIEYCSENLNPDGFGFLTNHHGHYIGDAIFEPIFAALNARKAVVFIHPTTPCTKNLDLDSNVTTPCTPATPLAPLYPRPMFEFFFDSARCYINLFLQGLITRYPSITYCITHAGGVLPPLLDRFSSIPALLKPPGMDLTVSPSFVRDRLLSDQFFFDTAGWSLPTQIAMFRVYFDGLDSSDSSDTSNRSGGRSRAEAYHKFVYGSDFPWTPLSGVHALSQDHEKYLDQIFPGKTEEIGTRNAERLLARSRRG